MFRSIRGTDGKFYSINDDHIVMLQGKGRVTIIFLEGGHTAIVPFTIPVTHAILKGALDENGEEEEL